MKTALEKAFGYQGDNMCDLGGGIGRKGRIGRTVTNHHPARPAPPATGSRFM